jgi:hypothetical protein
MAGNSQPGFSLPHLHVPTNSDSLPILPPALWEKSVTISKKSLRKEPMSHRTSRDPSLPFRCGSFCPSANRYDADLQSQAFDS